MGFPCPLNRWIIFFKGIKQTHTVLQRSINSYESNYLCKIIKITLCGLNDYDGKVGLGKRVQIFTQLGYSLG